MHAGVTQEIAETVNIGYTRIFITDHNKDNILFPTVQPEITLFTLAKLATKESSCQRLFLGRSQSACDRESEGSCWRGAPSGSVTVGLRIRVLELADRKQNALISK